MGGLEGQEGCESRGPGEGVGLWVFVVVMCVDDECVTEMRLMSSSRGVDETQDKR